MSLSFEGQNLPANQISLTYLNLLALWKNKRATYWNFTSSFDFDHITVLGMSLCIRLPNFVQIGDMMLYRFSKWRPLRSNFTSGFRSGDVAFFGCQFLSANQIS